MFINLHGIRLNFDNIISYNRSYQKEWTHQRDKGHPEGYEIQFHFHSIEEEPCYISFKTQEEREEAIKKIDNILGIGFGILEKERDKLWQS